MGELVTRYRARLAILRTLLAGLREDLRNRNPLDPPDWVEPDQQPATRSPATLETDQ